MGSDEEELSVAEAMLESLENGSPRPTVIGNLDPHVAHARWLDIAKRVGINVDADGSLSTTPGSLGRLKILIGDTRGTIASQALDLKYPNYRPTLDSDEPLAPATQLATSIRDVRGGRSSGTREPSRSEGTRNGIARPERIFVNYRRNDSKQITGRIDDHLRNHFGDAGVYRDIDDIPPGVDFEEHIGEAVRACDVCVAVIGPDWASPRIFDPNDFVRYELEAAIAHRIPIIPVLVEGASLPQRDQLPESLHPLLRLNAIHVDSGINFRVQIGRLAKAIKTLRKHAPKKGFLLVPLLLLVGIFGAGGLAAIYLMTATSTSPTPSPTPTATATATTPTLIPTVSPPTRTPIPTVPAPSSTPDPAPSVTGRHVKSPEELIKILRPLGHPRGNDYFPGKRHFQAPTVWLGVQDLSDDEQYEFVEEDHGIRYVFTQAGWEANQGKDVTSGEHGIVGIKAELFAPPADPALREEFEHQKRAFTQVVNKLGGRVSQRDDRNDPFLGTIVVGGSR